MLCDPLAPHPALIQDVPQVRDGHVSVQQRTVGALVVEDKLGRKKGAAGRGRGLGVQAETGRGTAGVLVVEDELGGKGSSGQGKWHQRYYATKQVSDCLFSYFLMLRQEVEAGG